MRARANQPGFIRRAHYGVIAALPFLMMAVNRNWLFQNGVHVDPWLYFGLFHNFERLHNLVWNYAGERIAWVAPGYVLVHLLGAIPGLIVLHVSVILLCLFTYYRIVDRLVDTRTAFLATMVFGCNSFFIGTNTWDYPESLAIFFLLLSFAAVLPGPRPARPAGLIFSGGAWLALVYTYLAWISFTPAYLLVVVRLTRVQWRAMRDVGRTAAYLAIGGLATTALFWGTFAAMGGKGFFFAHNIQHALYLAGLETNPWIDPNWLRNCTWLVFPVLAFLLAAAVPILGRSGLRKEFGDRTGLQSFYLYSFLVMVAWTLRPNRLLAFDYRTSILLPGAFLVFALLIFRVPEYMPAVRFYGITAAASVISVAPLAYSYLSYHAPGWTVVIAAAVSIVLMSCYTMMRPRTLFAWTLPVLLFSGISFALAPPSKLMAWRSGGRDSDMSERVSRAIRLLFRRAAAGTHPIIWKGPAGGGLPTEFEAIASASLTLASGMPVFPEVGNTFPPGTRLFLLTESRYVAAGAPSQLARKKMPARIVSQDQIEYGDVGYWITQIEILPPGATGPPVSQESGEAARSESDNLVSNGGFEEGTGEWAPSDGAVRLIEDCHRGTCAKMTGFGGHNQYIMNWKAARLKPGVQYEYSGWVRAVNPESQELVTGVWDATASRWIARLVIAATGNWTEFRVPFTNDSANWLSTQFAKTSERKGSFAVDEVAIREIAGQNQR
jgi:hypothetical protein